MMIPSDVSRAYMPADFVPMKYRLSKILYGGKYHWSRGSGLKRSESGRITSGPFGSAQNCSNIA